MHSITSSSKLIHADPHRRTFCAGVLALTASPAVSFVGVPTPGPDVAIIEAVEEWLRLEPRLTDLLRRRDQAFASSRAIVGECPTHDVAANRLWWDRWRVTECGRLEIEWERLASVSDEYLTFATNSRAVTADGIAAKIRLYRASLAYFGDDSDGYMWQRIEGDLAALGGTA